MPKKSCPTLDVDQSIDASTVYTLPELSKRSRQGGDSLRAAQSNGLRTIKIGRVKYVLGKDWIAWLESQADGNGKR